MKKNRILINAFTTLAVVYTGACCYLYFFQRSILYLPDKHLEEPAKYGLPKFEELKITTSDNVKLTAWYIPAKKGKPTLAYFHGNAGNLGRRAEKFKDFANTGIGILAISYRGFGTSEGLPTEEGLYNDARAAIKYLEEKGLKPSDITLYGESLGTGVAIQMATEDHFHAIILEAPYDRISARAAELYPYAPIDFLLKDKFDSISKISKINEPIMIFHSKDDKVMPFKHGQKLFDAANQPKKLYVFENAGHSHFNHDELAKLVIEFTKAKNNN
jgi:fermentation-respiration switch protein FrsA (DUF1100 family)